MITRENLNYAVRNLLNRKVRSSLTILSIFVGISTIFLFISFGWGLYFYIDELSSEMGVDKIVVQAKGIGAPGLDEAFQLGETDLQALQKTRGIIKAAGMAFQIVKIENDNKIVYSYSIGLPTHEKEELLLVEEFFVADIEEGRQVQDGDLGKVVLGYNFKLPQKIFEKPLKLGDKITVNGQDLKIIGFYEEIGNPSDDANIYLDRETYLQLHHENAFSYAMMVGKVDDVSDVDALVDRATKNIRKARDLEEGKEDFFVQSSEELIESFKSSLSIVIGFIVLIAFISVFVSAVNTSNTMFTSILERTKEIGILKAIGAKNSEILVIFLLESGLLGSVAGTIGVLVGWLLAYAGGRLLDLLGWGFLSPYFPPLLFIGCILFATFVGTLSGIIPAYHASRKSPVDSLRYE